MAFQIDINGYIGEDGGIFDTGESFSLKKLNDKLAAMPATETEINVMINSGGGLVTEGFAIYDRLASLPQTVNTTVLGMCGSIATIIAQAGKKGTRAIYQNSEYFIHNPFWQPEPFSGFDAAQLQAVADDLKANEEKILGFYATVTGKSKKSLSEKMKEAKTLTPDEAKDMGFVDKVINTVIAAMPRYRLVAVYTPSTQTKNDNTMSNFLAEIKASFKALDEKFDKLTNGGGAKKPIKASTKDGKELFHEGEFKVGAKVFSDESMSTALPDGEYTVGDKLYKVAGGAVESEAPVGGAAKTVAELQAELDAKTAENATLASQLSEIKASKEKAEGDVATLATEFKNFKATFLTGGNFKPEFEQAFKGGGEGAPENPLDKVIAMRKEREANASKK